MSKEKRRVPKLRFPGFTEDWEQRKLGSILIEYTEKNPGNENLPVLTSSRQGLTKQEEHFGSVQRHDISDYNVIPLGFCTYRNRSDDKSFTFNINRIVPRGLVSKFYPVFEIKNGNVDFITEYLNNNVEIIKSLAINAVGTSQVVLSLRTLRNIEVTLPLKAEQVAIGNLMRKLDIYITLHQRKLDNLKLKKKALLQKLFPKNGERYPELRFPGFTDAWEQRKLGECMNSFAYGLNAAAKNYDGMHKYIRITDIDDETHNFIQSNLTSPDIDFNMDVSDYRLNVGDIVFARTGASVGKTYLYNPNDGDLYYAGFLIRGKVKEDCDAGFIYQNTLTKEYDSFIRITSQRSGQPGVNSKEYATFRLNIPCKDEQEKISKILNCLDELFTLHQRKLDHLQLQKKALLQQMFV